MQPAAGMESMRQFPVVKANGGGGGDSDNAGSIRRRPFANGQFILVRREDYLKLGGHEAVRSQVLEDVELARAADRAGIACGFFLDGGMLGCRMYDSYAALRRGWKRIFGEAGNRRPERLRKIARRVRLLGTVLPMLTLAALIVGIIYRRTQHHDLATAVTLAAAIAILTWLGVIIWSFTLGRIPLISAFAFPIGSWIVGGIMNEAAADLEKGKPTEWGGMQIVREAR